MERFQALCVSGEYGPCFTGVKKNGSSRGKKHTFVIRKNNFVQKTSKSDNQ